MATSNCVDHLFESEAETSSTRVTPTVTGSHQFKVIGYSFDKGAGVGNDISSSTFTIGGYEWAIIYYPDGYEEEDDAYIAFFLELKSEATNVKARSSMYLLDQNGNFSFGRPNTKPDIFKRKGSRWGRRRFIERTQFESSEFIQDDCFTVKCVVSVAKAPVLQVTELRSVKIPPSDLNQQFIHLLEDGRGADVTFEVGGQSFKAHRCVLAARSSVFSAELFGAMKETRESRIKIDGIEAPVFKAMLHFIYSDTLPESEYLADNDSKQHLIAMSQHLLVVADRYGLERLRLICEDRLVRNIDVANVATTLALAEQHNCSRLKAACLKFMSAPEMLRAIMMTEGFPHLMRICPSILEELPKKA